MRPTEPAEPQHGPELAPSGKAAGTGGPTAAPVGTARYSVPQAARRLGISERAVRKRIEADSLLAVREGRSWVVILEEPASGTSTAAPPVPAAPAASRAVIDEDVAEPAALDAARTAGVDLTPLVNLVAELAKRNAELTEAATIWQVRARQLEEQVKQLTAGDVAHDDDDDQTAPESPQTPHNGSGATTAASPSPEAQAAPTAPPGTRFARWWAWISGR